jgi:predicted XRE-type DNA-binding protein
LLTLHNLKAISGTYSVSAQSRHGSRSPLGQRLTPLTGTKEVIKMGRNPDDIVAALPQDRQQAINERHQELTQEIEGLRELRQIAGKAQAEVASALNITQPSVSKIEKQTDMHFSTLRNYVEAIGGELELTVKLPERPALRIHHLGDLAPISASQARKKSGHLPPRRPHG